MRYYTQLHSYFTCLFLQGNCWSARPERGVTPGSCTPLLKYLRQCNKTSHKRTANSGVPRGKGLEFITMQKPRNLNKVKLEAQWGMVWGRFNTQESEEGRVEWEPWPLDDNSELHVWGSPADSPNHTRAHDSILISTHMLSLKKDTWSLWKRI